MKEAAGHMGRNGSIAGISKVLKQVKPLNSALIPRTTIFQFDSTCTYFVQLPLQALEQSHCSVCFRFVNRYQGLRNITHSLAVNMCIHHS